MQARGSKLAAPICFTSARPWYAQALLTASFTVTITRPLKSPVKLTAISQCCSRRLTRRPEPGPSPSEGPLYFCAALPHHGVRLLPHSRYHGAPYERRELLRYA